MKKTLVTLLALCSAPAYGETYTMTTNAGSSINYAAYYGWTVKLTDNFLSTTGTTLEATDILTLDSVAVLSRGGGSDVGTLPTAKLAVYQYARDNAVGTFMGLSTNAVTNIHTNEGRNTFTFSGLEITAGQQYQFLFVSQDTTAADLATTGLAGYQAKSGTYRLTFQKQASLPSGDGTYTNNTINGWQGLGIPDVVYTTSTPTAVPEPATATLSLLALAGLAARRRRK